MHTGESVAVAGSVITESLGSDEQGSGMEIGPAGSEMLRELEVDG